MKRIVVLFLLTLIISQGLVSFAQEDPCQSEVDALNECRASQTTAAPADAALAPASETIQGPNPACGPAADTPCLFQAPGGVCTIGSHNGICLQTVDNNGDNSGCRCSINLSGDSDEADKPLPAADTPPDSVTTDDNTAATSGCLGGRECRSTTNCRAHNQSCTCSSDGSTGYCNDAGGPCCY